MTSIEKIVLIAAASSRALHQGQGGGWKSAPKSIGVSISDRKVRAAIGRGLLKLVDRNSRAAVITEKGRQAIDQAQ